MYENVESRVYLAYVKVFLLNPLRFRQPLQLNRDKTRSETVRQTLQQQVILVPGQTPD